MNTRSMTRFAFILATTALVACTTTPAPNPMANVTLPDTWKGSTTIGEDSYTNWWERFKSTELNTLLDTAIAHNTDLRAGISRIDQARAQTRIAGSGLFPAISASGSTSRSEGQGTSSSTAYNTHLSISYEVDLWQRQRQTRNAAEERLEAQKFDYEALALVVATDTATQYFQTVTLKERIRLTRDNLRAFRDVANIVQARYNEGAATGLDVAQQNTALANAEAGLATLEKQLTQTENALAVLTGMMPQQFDGAFKTTLDGLTVPTVAAAQPATLLQRRPDIRAQESRLLAANANLNVARTALFPRLVLGATPTLGASSLSLSPDFTVGLLASVTQRIFEGGAIQGEIDLAKAQQQEMVEQYRGTVLTAFRESEDALADITAATKREEMLRRAMNESRTAYRIARESYLDGATDFIPLLDAQRSMLQAQDSYAQTRMDRLVAATALFKAMGGGWQSR